MVMLVRRVASIGLISLILQSLVEGFATRTRGLSKQQLPTDYSPSSLGRGDVSILLQSTSLDDDERMLSEEVTQVSTRRQLFTSLTAALVSASSLVEPASAYEKSYPAELVQGSLDDLDSRQRKKNKILQKERRRVSPLATVKPVDWVLWGGALWFLSGSRSNPLATPLANAIYKVEDEKWIQDRNDGLFAALPWEFLVILSLVFCALGAVVDMAVVTLSEGDVNLSLELAGVSLIAGGALELGRIASGEKKQTRKEADRSELLRQEFEQFATDRLKPGGNCHRNEVVACFRRYYSQYRDADNEEFPLSDVEIEQLLRSWSRSNGMDMSSAGFYNGIQINAEADAFKSIW